MKGLFSLNPRLIGCEAMTANTGKKLNELRVMIRGAGEMASGVAHRLARSHFRLVMTELEAPLAIRRETSFCEAVYSGEKEVEGVVAKLVSDYEEIEPAWEAGKIPLFTDPGSILKERFRPDVLVDAIMAKVNRGTTINDAPLVIALGPGFTAGEDAHMVVETNRGHDLGRLIFEGGAEPDTGKPAPRMGYTEERVLRAPADGVFNALIKIGDTVTAGQTVCMVDREPVKARISGVLRGMLMDGLTVKKGLKIGDIDPSGDRSICYTISEKARAIGGAVLEGILINFNAR
jgi:xanthine dehydrogenase accessory factor